MIDFKKILSVKNKWESLDYLKEALWEMVGDAKTMTEVSDNGLRRLFEKALPKDVAADFCAIVIRLEEYTYGTDTYRRSYRSAVPRDYYDKLLELAEEIYFDWDKFDLLTCLKIGNTQIDDEDDKKPGWWTLPLLISLKIDRNDNAIINAVREIILSDNNTRAVSHELIRAVAMSHNTELHGLMKDLLLAARLQEGLRQAILETADDGVLDYFRLMIKTVLENDLLRYSSALRAVCVWMGLGYDYSDRRTVEKLLKLGFRYVEDEAERQAAIGSADMTMMYAAMWAESVFSIQNLNAHIERYMHGEKYQKLAGAYFLHEADSHENSIRIAGEALVETDMDCLTLILTCYSLSLHEVSDGYWYEDEAKKKILHDKYPAALKDKSTRDRHFLRLAEILINIPKNGHNVKGKPFDWCDFTLTRGEVFETMMALAVYDRDAANQRRLVELFPFAESKNKCDFLDYFIAFDVKNDKLSDENRTFLFGCMSDKSMPTRTRAVKMIKKMTPDEAELAKVEELFALKTGEIRQIALEVIRNAGSSAILTSIKRLIADKNELKRLAALDLLASEKKSGATDSAFIREILTSMPAPTDTESIIINSLLDTDVIDYTKENGFGLYNPDYFPTLPPVERDNIYNLKLFREKDAKDMIKVFDSLTALIHQHKDHAYKAVYYYGNDEDFILGNASYLHAVVKRDEDRMDSMDDYVLGGVWSDWLMKNKDNIPTIIKIAYCDELCDWEDDYDLDDYKPFVRDLIKKHLGYDEIKAFIKKRKSKDYYALAQSIISKLLSCFSERLNMFAVYHGILADFFLSTSKKDWENPCNEERSDYYYNSENKLADTNEISFFVDRINPVSYDEYLKKLALCYAIGEAAGSRYDVLNIEDVAYAATHGIVEKGELRRAVMQLDGSSIIEAYTGTLYTSGKAIVGRYPILLECVEEVAARVIEIELKRGDTKTPVSELAHAIKRHEGAEVFSNTLVALGKETLARGYLYSRDYTKREVLSALLKSSVPGKTDDATTLRKALDGRVADKRLLEAAMYAPSWIGITEDYLGWEGLKCAAWYFHAHTRNSFSSQFETEVARFSPIDKEDFQRGAFDVNWFREAYETLGAERFGIVYDCAKYISDGAAHRRAQLFADAVLGKLSIDELEPQIRDKRNKDLLLSYSLAPFGPNKTREALRRYEFINEFLKKSREFGAQRQASEKEAVGIALDNLARNLGYDDVLRFNWKMEMEKLEEITGFFKPHDVVGTSLFLEMEDSGLATLVVEKGGKRLKSVPAAIKNEPYVKDINEVKSALKTQFSRARTSLEKAMEKQDAFSFADISELLQHPVISPIIRKLVFRSGDNLGFLQGGGSTIAHGGENLDFMPGSGLKLVDGSMIALGSDDKLTIAHCYDLFALGQWIDFQHYAFDNNLIQPFKQIFRELYTVNEDEKSEKTISRRYAGHQIQPNKTVALLKGRGWTVDYEDGLQKVYYRENIIAQMFALADWFSPSDIEAPTLETVCFFERKTGKPLNFEDIHPVLFSEVMRDVDLVVSVAHVGGVDPMASHSTMEMRAVIVAESARLLKLANVSVGDRHVRIRGTLGEYSIHLGSGIAHISGRGALNILPVHSQHRGRIFLPFLDEDPKTAEIVAKTLLLAEDSKIKDPTVMKQLTIV